MKVQADAEHHQNDADLGELLGDGQIAAETRRVRPDEHAGEQVADDRRQSQAMGDVAADQGRAERGGKRRNQFEIAVHAASRALERHGTLVAT